jgi:penicillin-binding protein 1A
VGGEYRAIHFRTGQLGQGSRTALPVCGLFYEKVLDDERFPQYHGKFIGKEGIENLTDQMYIGPSYRMRADTDTMATDSVFTLERIDGNSLTTQPPGDNPNTDTQKTRLETLELQMGKDLEP